MINELSTYELSTSFGKSKISCGIPLPVKKFDNSFEKLLQLC